LRNVLGSHVNQSGSLVEPDRLRFDFSHFSSVSSEDLEAIESEVNEKILENLPVTTEEMSIDEAKKQGATALFGEKYGSIVRVVKIGDYSMELCGGTHINSTAQAGLVKILGESGVAAGIRRIEALTGQGAINYFNKKEELLNEVASALKTNPQDSVKRIEALTSEIKSAHKEIEQLRNKLVSGSIEDVISKTVEIKGVKVICARFGQLDMDALRNTSDMLKNKIGSGVFVLASDFSDKVNFVVTATKDVIEKGIHSGNIIKEVAKIAGGGGGGRPDMAQAGGKDISKIDEALQYSLKIIESQIK
jgi:alanyl-tRNA synthetase